MFDIGISMIKYLLAPDEAGYPMEPSGFKWIPRSGDGAGFSNTPERAAGTVSTAVVLQVEM